MVFPIWSLIPFFFMLSAIAVMPVIAPTWWGRNPNKVVFGAIVSTPVLYLVIPYAHLLLTHALMNYVSFVVLMGALFVISGGIFIQGSFMGTPLMNTALLASGAVLSNLIGTTGASMVLIRPYLRANRRRQRKSHLIVFFIFLVSNIGGLLTPLGDPPLFLGFLLGVPFQWTLRLFPVWAFAVGALLIVFNLFDQIVFNREEVESHGEVIEDLQPRRGLHIQGALNFAYLQGVVGAAMSSSYFGWPKGVQELMMIALALLSWFTTPRRLHEANLFDFEPIAEVAALFLGIFVTMIPAVEILNQRAPVWGFHKPWEYFWLSGVFSSFLDSAPAYLTFAAMASGVVGGSAENLTTLVHSVAGEQLLRAVSCGSVFMGAVTYIGNGPNFMVKSIAQRASVNMPSFGGYLLYSGLILLPLFVLITLVFFPTP